MRNKDIRQKSKAANVKLWQIAERYKGGMTDSNFSRKLRRELSEAEKAEILQIIFELSGEESDDD